MKIKYWNEANNTCMLPMRCENRTRPDMQMRMLNNVSPLKVLVTRLCPYELHMTALLGKLLAQPSKVIFQICSCINCQTSINKIYLYTCTETERQRDTEILLSETCAWGNILEGERTKEQAMRLNLTIKSEIICDMLN